MVLTRRSLLGVALPLMGAESRSLFDGASTKGWRAVGDGEFPSRSWSVDDGCLKALVSKPAFQDIRTVDVFEDFELEFEWKITPNGNSGVKYLIYREDVWKPAGSNEFHARGRGFEYQIADGTSARQDLEAAGGVYEFQAPSRLNARAAGEFNEARIVRRGAAIEHWLNGVRVVELRLDTPEILERMRSRKVPTELPQRTPIVLQNHGFEAWFRRLNIRSL